MLVGRKTETQGLKGKLESNFDKKCQLIRHSEVPKIGEMPAVKKKPCSLFGTCFCSGDGFEAMQFHGNLSSMLKSLFTPPRKRKADSLQVESDDQMAKRRFLASNRQMLQSLHIVLHLQMVDQPDHREEGSDTACASNNPWSSVLDTMLQESTCSGPSELWFHIGTVNYTTWFFSVLQLHPVESRGARRRLRVARAAEFGLSAVAFKKCVDFTVPWSCTLYSIVDNDDALTLDSCRTSFVTFLILSLSVLLKAA